MRILFTFRGEIVQGDAESKINHQSINEKLIGAEEEYMIS
jgi:hypothetical protein